MAQTKSSRVQLRVAPRDDALLRSAAELSGESLSEFLVASGRERAERLLADRTHFTLTDAQWRAFTRALDQPVQVDARAVDLFSRPRPE